MPHRERVVEKTIKQRRSIRAFTGQHIDEQTIETILDAARWAPSGLNNQPWRFAVIIDTGIKDRLSTLTRYSTIIKSAYAVIAVFLDTKASYDRTKDLQAIGACIENMLLEITALGLGGVWLGEILKSASEVKELTGAPDEFEFMAAIALGHPDGAPPKAPGRKPLTELVFFRK
ncbi:MAG: nitroreductase [Deltaproteobacteria bacterium]|nr:nitroreductase [Deltaproteobacteria bacterium]